jgi:hypothetical protein
LAVLVDANDVVYTATVVSRSTVSPASCDRRIACVPGYQREKVVFDTRPGFSDPRQGANVAEAAGD